jgi:hypothetical protein
MEKASITNPDESAVPQGSNKRFDSLHPIILTSPVKIISLQQDIKSIAQDHFSLQTTRARIHTVTFCMADYKVIPLYLSVRNLHHFSYPQSDKPTKAVICHPCINTSSQDMTLALQEMGYDVISIKQTTVKEPLLDSSITTISLPLLLVLLAHSQKSQQILILTSLCNFVIRSKHMKPMLASHTLWEQFTDWLCENKGHNQPYPISQHS